MPQTPWYVDAFRADYLEVYAHRDDATAAREVKGALGLLRHDPRRGRLLDLASGAGRHSEAFAADGCHVTCLDLSADLVQRSRARGLRTVRADMRAVPFRDWSFDSVTCLFSSFGYFADDRDHQRTLDEIARVLVPGGRALLDLMDRETVARNLVPQSVDVIDTAVVEIERFIDAEARRVEKHLCLMRPGEAPRRWHESVRLFDEGELAAFAMRAGLRYEAQYGDYDGRPHAEGRTRRLVLLEKPR
ncbi:MAG: class I SAM-dependent methyltransferase [Planctomycetes bacterium]|nr:class I SAM-dependent methyltransferase [Planctomycetota bacterium]